MTEIKVVNEKSAEEFESEVNRLLKDGWELHGEPQFRSASVSDDWDGQRRGWVVQDYVQILKRVI